MWNRPLVKRRNTRHDCSLQQNLFESSVVAFKTLVYDSTGSQKLRLVRITEVTCNTCHSKRPLPGGAITSEFVCVV